MKSYEGKYIVDRKDILKMNLFRRNPYYLVIWMYLLSEARFKATKKEARGSLFLENGIQTILDDLKPTRNSNNFLTYDLAYNILRFFKSCTAIDMRYTEGGIWITITDYDNGQRIRR